MNTGTCTYVVRTLVRFYGMGEHDSTNTVKVTSRDPNKVVIPDRAHSFVFYDEVTATVELNGQMIRLVNDSEQLFPFGMLNRSPVHYCGGELFTLEDGERLFGNHKSVDITKDVMDAPSTSFDAIREGRLPGVTHVIQRRDGNIACFREGTNVIVPLPETATA